MHYNFIHIQVNHMLRIISISNCVEIYLIFRPFMLLDTIKTVTLFITYTLCNNFIFIFNLEKVQNYGRNNSIQALNAKL